MSKPTIDELRVSIADARRELTIREAKQESTGAELEALEAECKELGFDPGADLVTEAQNIRDDVEEAVAGVFKALEGISE